MVISVVCHKIQLAQVDFNNVPRILEHGILITDKSVIAKLFVFARSQDTIVKTNNMLTIFFFVWFLNILGLSPLGINVTGNIAVTFGLALLTFLITNLTANKNYWAHIFWMPGVPVLMKIVLAPIELLGVIIKPFSLLIRLYANIQAGHIVLMSLIGLMFIFNNWLGSSLSFVLAFAISIIEVLVALLQAYIFTMLSALYFGFAVEEHEEAH